MKYIHLEPDLEIPVISEDPEEIAVKDVKHERIQAEIHHKTRRWSRVEEMLEVPPEWNEVPDLMMEEKEVPPATEAAVKQNIHFK